MICPHCHFQIMGPGVPREASEDCICPVCYLNMSDQPIPFFTGPQKFGKNLATILFVFPLGWIGGGFIMSFDIVGAVPVGLTLLAMFGFGEYLGKKLKKMPSVAARWWLILVVALFPYGIWGVYLLFSTPNFFKF